MHFSHSHLYIFPGTLRAVKENKEKSLKEERRYQGRTESLSLVWKVFNVCVVLYPTAISGNEFLKLLAIFSVKWPSFQ